MQAIYAWTSNSTVLAHTCCTPKYSPKAAPMMTPVRRQNGLSYGGNRRRQTCPKLSVHTCCLQTSDTPLDQRGTRLDRVEPDFPEHLNGSPFLPSPSKSSNSSVLGRHLMSGLSMSKLSCVNVSFISTSFDTS